MINNTLVISTPPSSDFEAITAYNLLILKCTLASLAIFVISSTFYDVYKQFITKDKPSQLLISFSLYTNASKLFHLKENPTNSIGVLHGIRSLSILSIILVHTYWFRVASPFVDEKTRKQFLETKVSFSVSAASTCVDSFFVLSGLLITLSILRELDRKSLNLWKMYFQRFMRLSPCLALMILINDYLATTTLSLRQVPIGSYESASSLNYSVIPCRHYWWSAIFHIQNFVNPHELCMHTTWYLSVDFQMFLIAPCFVYLLWKFNGRYLSIIYLLALISCFYVFGISMHENFVISDYNLSPEIYNSFYELLYYPTHVRGASYLIGIILGYHMYYKDNKAQDNDNLTILLTITSFLVVGTPISIYTVFQIMGREIILNATFLTFFRVVWSIAIAWIIFSCQNGLNKYLNYFLSWRIWIPMARIGLSIYLVHPVLQFSYVIWQGNRFSFDLTERLLDYFLEIIITIVCAMVVFLTVEEPFYLIGKHITRKRSNNSS